MTRFIVGFVVAAAVAATTSPPPDAEGSCSAATPGGGACLSEQMEAAKASKILAAEVPSDAEVQQMSLLQVGAAPRGSGGSQGHGHGEGLAHGQVLGQKHVLGQTPAAASTRSKGHGADASDPELLRLAHLVSTKAARTNSSLCMKLTGGTCFMGPCSDSSTCNSMNMCQCPDYCCTSSEGKCVLSLDEIAGAVKDGATGIVDKVTGIAATIPGIADSVDSLTGAFNGISDSVTGALKSWTGMAGDCDDYVSTCMVSDCDESLGYTVACTWGTCNCKPGFCYKDGKCVMNLKSMFQQGLTSMR